MTSSPADLPPPQPPAPYRAEAVSTFFRRSLQQDRLRLCRRLFAGKMTLDDVAAFEPLFEDGVLAPPRWLPRWVSRANGLAGMLAFSLFANRIRLDRLSADG